MDISIFLGFGVFCLAIYAITYIVRVLLEAIPKINLKSRLFWSGGILPAMPLLLGAALSFIPSTAAMCPYTFGATLIGRIFCGLSAGLFSSFVYSKIRSFIKDYKISVTNTGSNTNTEAIETAETSPQVEGILESAMDGAEKSD